MEALRRESIDGRIGTKQWLKKANTAAAEVMQQATQQFLEGRLEESARLCRQVLRANRNDAGSLNLLGMIAYQGRNYEMAVQYHELAVTLESNNAYYQSNLGGDLEAKGKLKEAAIHYTRAILLKPDLAEAHYNLANVLRAQGRPGEAIASYQEALKWKPGLIQAHTNLGNVYRDQGRLDEALACYQATLVIDPDCAEAHANRGNILRERGDLVAAEACYRHAIALNPRLAEAQYNLANILHSLAAEERDRLEAAAVRYECALAANPALHEAHYNLGCIFTVLGNTKEALVRHRRAIALQPKFARARLAEALVQLLQGDFAAGWPSYEWRWQSADHDTAWRAYPVALWRGETLEAGCLLIWGEQGIGDEIMFAGLLPDAIKTGNRCVLDCNARLQPLFARSFPEVEVVSGYMPSTGRKELDIAAHLPGGSLGGLFRTTASSLALARSPYLVADPALREHFRTRYQTSQGDGVKEDRLVGLAWQSRNAKTGLRRSIDLQIFSSLFDQSNVCWISLQYGDHDELEVQASAAQAPLLIDRSVDQLADLDTFAAQVASLDLVITIDNSTAHLAGALGVRVWLLLPYSGDWRWQQGRSDSPWYPSMRLFRQPQPGDWLHVIESVREQLGHFTNTPPLVDRPAERSASYLAESSQEPEHMLRKQIIGQPTAIIDAHTDVRWLNLPELATVELTSEDPRYPFDPVLEEGGDCGWRADEPGKQTVRLRFDQPQAISRIRVRFTDRDHERSQEFVLRYGDASGSLRDIVRQQWSFSPGGSTEEVEDYTVDLPAVSVIELEIDPDRGRDTLPATLAELLIS